MSLLLYLSFFYSCVTHNKTNNFMKFVKANKKIIVYFVKVFRLLGVSSPSPPLGFAPGPTGL